MAAAVEATAGELIGEIDTLYAGHSDGTSLVAAFRRAAVLVPRCGPDAVLSRDFGGITWILGFTSAAELARFAEHAGAAGPGYLLVRGWRLLDVAVPELDGPGGVAVDIAGARPAFFPPVPGIVPDDVAVREGLHG